MVQITATGLYSISKLCSQLQCDSNALFEMLELLIREKEIKSYKLIRGKVCSLLFVIAKKEKHHETGDRPPVGAVLLLWSDLLRLIVGEKKNGK